MTERAYIGLGSNLGDRRALLEAGIRGLDRTPGVSVHRTSTIFETEPVGPAVHRFLNTAVAVDTTLDPRALLSACLVIERDAGRDRAREQRWGPRTLDLDLLLHGDRVLDEEGLTVPHPRMTERAFVLEPLAEIAPDLIHPVIGTTIRDLARALSIQA